MSTSDNVCKRCGGVLSFQFATGPAVTTPVAPIVTFGSNATNSPYVHLFDATVTASAGPSTIRFCSCPKSA